MARNCNLMLFIIFKVFGHLTAPALWCAVFTTKSSLFLIPAIGTNIVYANIAAHTADSDEHVITIQLFYWWASWAWLIGRHSEFFSPQ